MPIVPGSVYPLIHTKAESDLWEKSYGKQVFTGAWLEGGPENPNNILIRVSADSAEYWDSPGSKVTQVANLVKAKVTAPVVAAHLLAIPTGPAQD